ncbi:hypothetical protein PV11_04526 [Exophiala sideris]|uniref:F-box domain-containing protein n=1 Tax=Exophiala sideris TaxID=1016849 RepID=A0A0D1X464_9EURO|nr:hypothetical protein PV11_04526 [Exophiala sideris]
MAFLANEIVLKIIDELRDDRTALVNLAKTCKHFYAMTEAHRFRKVHLRTKGDLLLLKGHLQSNYFLHNMVETLVIGPEQTIRKEDFWQLKQTAKWFRGLQHLSIRYPQQAVTTNHEQLFYPIKGSHQFIPAMLRSCTLVFDDNATTPQASLNLLVPLFSRSRLEELNIVGARLDDISPHYMRSTTPVKTLRLENCHRDTVYLYHLRPMLRMSKSLQTFSFSMDATSFCRVPSHAYDDVDEPSYMRTLLRALGNYHGKSLTRLELKFNYTRILGSTCPDDTPSDLFKHSLAQFVQLKHFELGLRTWEWSDFRPARPDLVIDGAHRTQIHLFLSLLPHTLESFKLRVIDGPGVPVTGMQYLCEKIIEWKAEQVDLKLFELEYVENRDPATTACIMQRAQIQETGKALKKEGIQFRVYETVIEKAEARGMVHGLHLPTFVRVYDSYGNGAFEGQGTKMELMDDWYRNCGERLY